MPAYVPEAGDLVWLDFNPQAGREQAGHRPAVVISPAAYNGKTGLMICCPVTTKLKGYVFEVSLNGPIASVVLADQVKNFDWRERNAEYKGKIAAAELSEIRRKIRALIG
jgi:mRNA interferase MazF